MNFLNTAAAQLRDLFLSMTAGARITAGLLLAVVVVSLAYLFQQGSSGPDVYLFGAEHFPAGQLHRMEAAIARRNLNGAVRDGNRIRVPAGQKSDYLAAIAEENALPRDFHSILDKALDGGSVWESRETTQQRLRVAKAQTLSEIVRAMNWVDDAIVLIDEQPRSGWNKPREVTGSVNVMPIAGESLSSQRKKALRTMVARSVSGLDPESIAVTSLGEDTSFGGDGLDPDRFENEYLRNRALFSEYQRQQILEVVNFIPGVRVQVNADLENISEDISESVKPEEKVATLREFTSKDTTERTNVDDGDRPGLVSQGPGRQQEAVAARTNKDSTSSSVNESENLAGWVKQMVHKTGFMPSQVEATIAIPRDYLVDVWRQRNPTPPGQVAKLPVLTDLESIEAEVLSKVENLIEPLLPGHVQGEDTYKYVSVQFVDSPTRPTIPEPTFAETATAWTARHWSTLAMVGLALIALLILRSMINAKPTDEASPALTLDFGEPEEETEEEEEPVQRLRLKKGPSLKDDLIEMVREDPDAAATILRSWIGKAA